MRETLEMVLDAHVQAFQFFGGSCRKGIYQSDSLGYIKARILYKLGQSDQAKITLKLYIADHAESESKYVVKAKQLLESI